MIWPAALIWIPVLLLGGAYLVAVLDGFCLQTAASRRPGDIWRAPVNRLLRDVRRQRLTTEAPDNVGRWLAPAVYLVLAALALALVPMAPGQALIDSSVGIVAWGAVESLTVVAVFLHGWSQNSLFPLIGGYRFVALGLSAMLLSMFVLIGVALPAQSLSLTAIVEAQADLWNLIRQPLGLPLFLLLGLTITLREPANFADSADLAGGTSVEDSGLLHASWRLARAAMLVAFSAVAASAFLGGYHGPLLPGSIWLLLKLLAVLALLVTLSHVLVRPDASRALGLLWTVLLPLSFLDLALAGVESLR